jgi:hypothetical protein
VIAQLVASSAGIAGNNAVFRVVRAGITDATTEPLQYLLGIRQTRFSDGGAALVPHAYGYQGAVLALVP